MMIGSRLKRLDQLIEDTFERAFAEAGVNRRQWQALNVISRGPTSAGELHQALRPFRAPGDTTPGVLARLTARGWIVRDATGTHTLTAEGRTAHAAIGERVQDIRARMTRDITPEEYAKLMDTLGRMTHNLDQGTMER
ncbi:MarR family winged helix-turn-helix transcriptional regulator [Nonomuraea sp. NPDC003214]